MNSRRTFYVMLGLLFLATFSIVAGVYGANGLLLKESNKLVKSKAKLEAMNQQQADLVKSKKDIATYSELYKIARGVVPQNKDQAQTVRQIVKLASDNGVVLQSISFPSSTLGGSGAAASTRPAQAGAAASPASGGGGASLSQLAPVPKIPGVYKMSLVVTSSSTAGNLANYRQLINFLDDLEQNRLTALVSTIAITPNGGNNGASAVASGLFSFTLTLDVYIKP